MLPRLKRLTTELFKEVVQKGSISHGTFSVIRCQNRPDRLVSSKNSSNFSRFGVSVPKRVAKTAVLRNKIKRRIYSIVRKFENRIITGKNVIIIMKNGAETAKYKELEQDIETIFVKSGLLK